MKPWEAAGTPWQRTFPSLFSCLFWALRAYIMRPWLAWTGSNCNAFCCSVTIWILMPSCPGWPRLTIWKPEGNKSLYIMRDLRVPQSVISAPNNEWANTRLCREGRFGTLRFWSQYWQWVSCFRTLIQLHLAGSCMYVCVYIYILVSQKI